ncbi:MAG: hypothetical protein HY699_22435 [Deltaproteobacteria bacterium]|nr:hypothetical protein [Deltaproteobacteria bacterium]
MDKFFGRSRRELIERLGAVVPVAAAQRTGHAAPLAQPQLVLPLVMKAIARAELGAGSSARVNRSPALR